MYANSYSYASPPPGMSNNPFVDDPTTAYARFPDLNASTLTEYPHQYQPQYHPQPYGLGDSYQTQSQMTSPQSQFTSTSYAPQYPVQPGASQASTGTFQHTHGFAHQAYPIQPGYLTTYPGTGYPPTTTAAPSYLAEFDPYAQRHTHTETPAQPTQRTHGTPTPGGGSTGPAGVAHPRDVIRIHKMGLEAWETYSWKQLLTACDALKEAWSVRKQQAEGVVQQYSGLSDPGLFGPDPAFGYQNQVEGWKQVLRDASDNFDTVAASTFQLHEVFNSYRHSADQASKRRVRESCNAAVKGLPDWPSN